MVEGDYASNTHSSMSCSVAIELEDGDEIWVYADISSSPEQYESQESTVFSGFLVQAYS